MAALAAAAAWLLAGAAWSDPLPFDPRPINECDVVARVNGEVIIAREVLWEVELTLRERLAKVPAEQRASIPPEALEQTRRVLLQQLVVARLDMILFYSDFRAKMPQANLKAIHAGLEKEFERQELRGLMQRLGASDQRELDKKLYEVGTSIDERRDDFFRKMIARSWLTETVKYEKEVTHDQMLDYYHEHRAEFERPARARWEELMVRFDRFATKADAYAALAVVGNAAHAAAAAAPPGEPALADVARRLSHGPNASSGGLYSWTTDGSLAAEEVDRALFTLPIGQMSPILEGPTGFHIVRVVEREEQSVEPFSEAQNRIAETIRAKRFTEAINLRVTEMKRKARLWTAFTGTIDTRRIAAGPRPGPPTPDGGDPSGETDDSRETTVR